MEAGPSGVNLSDPSQEDPMAALELARALVDASVRVYFPPAFECDRLQGKQTENREVPVTPLKTWKTDSTTGGDRVNHRKRISSANQDQPVIPPPLPSTLRELYNPREGLLPLEHHAYTASPTVKGTQLINTQEQFYGAENKVGRILSS